jgi:Tfp pilus assembly protein PilN
LIRINLVAEGKKPVVARSSRKAGPSTSFDSENAALYSLIFGFALLMIGFGGWYYTLSRTIAANSRTINQKERRVAELKEYILRVEEFERKEAELQRKIQIIGDLKRDQRGPVEVMDQVSRALPDLLWLDRLEQKDRSYSLWGRAYNNAAVSNFVENLDVAGTFAEPVLKSTDRSRSSDVYDFQIELVKKAPPPPPDAMPSAPAVLSKQPSSRAGS